MIMADVLKIALLIAATYLVIISYWLLAASLFPAMVERCQARYTSRPWRTIFLGLLTALPVFFVGAALGKMAHPAAKLVGTIIMLLVVTIGLLGSAGLARRVGVGLPSERDAREPWRRVWRGGLVLGLTFLLPLVGWFLVLPVTLVSGFGAFVLSRRKRASADQQTLAEPPPVPAA